MLTGIMDQDNISEDSCIHFDIPYGYNIEETCSSWICCLVYIISGITMNAMRLNRLTSSSGVKFCLICSCSVSFDRIFHLDHLPLDRLLYENLIMEESYDQMRFRPDYVANS